MSRSLWRSALVYVLEVACLALTRVHVRLVVWLDVLAPAHGPDNELADRVWAGIQSRLKERAPGC